MKILRAGTKFFHARRRTEMTKLIVTFLNFIFFESAWKVKWILCILIRVERLRPTEIRVYSCFTSFCYEFMSVLISWFHNRTYKTQVSWQAGTARISCTNCDLLQWLRFSLFGEETWTNVNSVSLLQHTGFALYSTVGLYLPLHTRWQHIAPGK
jgi:hypothetical protein